MVSVQGQLALLVGNMWVSKTAPYGIQEAESSPNPFQEHVPNDLATVHTAQPPTGATTSQWYQRLATKLLASGFCGVEGWGRIKIQTMMPYPQQLTGFSLLPSSLLRCSFNYCGWFFIVIIADIYL